MRFACALLVALVAISAASAHVILPKPSLAKHVMAPDAHLNDTNGVGLRVTFLGSGLQKFLDIILYIVNTNFREMTLPDQHMDENVPVVGHVTVDITNIKIHNFRIPHGTAGSNAPSNFLLNLGPGIGTTIEANWHWRKVKWPHLSGHGSVTITPQNGDIAAAVMITPNAGHFHIQTTAVNCNFDKFDIKFHGGEAWLLNLIVKLLSHTLKKLIDNEIAKQLTNVLNGKLNEVLAHIPTTFAFGGGKARMNVDVQLVQATGTPQFLDFGLPLQITSVASGQVCPIAPPDIQPLDGGATGRMLQLFVGQHFLNCALWTIFSNGVLSHVIPSNTSEWLIWIPAIALTWPNMAMEEVIYEYKLGQITLAPGSGVTGQFPLALNLTVVTPQGRKHAAQLGVNVAVAFTMWVAPGHGTPAPYFFLKVAKADLTFSVIDSGVGPIDLSLLNGLVHILSPVIVKAIDDLIANGFPVPLSKGFTLSNPSVAFFNGYFGIEADFAYNPSLFYEPEKDDGFLMGPAERDHQWTNWQA